MVGGVKCQCKGGARREEIGRNLKGGSGRVAVFLEVLAYCVSLLSVCRRPFELVTLLTPEPFLTSFFLWWCCQGLVRMERQVQLVTPSLLSGPHPITVLLMLPGAGQDHPDLCLPGCTAPLPQLMAWTRTGGVPRHGAAPGKGGGSSIFTLSCLLTQVKVRTGHPQVCHRCIH